MGNHEQMLLEFIDDPVGRGLRWLRNGGTQTLTSFGLKGVTAEANAEDLKEIACAFEAALPDGLQVWLRALPLQWRSGNVVCVHAAMDPAQSPDAQCARAQFWGNDDFFRHPRKDGIWVAHGHKIMKEPTVKDGRIAIDTGAYLTGRLIIAEIVPSGCRFL
jgi:serine/threonine protein phosphatase 1